MHRGIHEVYAGCSTVRPTRTKGHTITWRSSLGFFVSLDEGITKILAAYGGSEENTDIPKCDSLSALCEID